jgi:hypothetical protein
VNPTHIPLFSILFLFASPLLCYVAEFDMEWFDWVTLENLKIVTNGLIYCFFFVMHKWIICIFVFRLRICLDAHTLVFFIISVVN